MFFFIKPFLTSKMVFFLATPKSRPFSLNKEYHKIFPSSVRPSRSGYPSWMKEHEANHLPNLQYGGVPESQALMSCRSQWWWIFKLPRGVHISYSYHWLAIHRSNSYSFITHVAAKDIVTSQAPWSSPLTVHLLLFY